MKKIIKNNYLLIIMFLITLFYLFLTSNIPNYLFDNLHFDDGLYRFYLRNILNGKYLGNYNNYTLIKGPFYSILMSCADFFNISYNFLNSIFYTFSCLFLTYELRNFIKNKKYLCIIYIILLFNPVSYSSELFQRFYRSSISLSEMYFFIACILRIYCSEKIKYKDYIFLGIILGIIFITREDILWLFVPIFLLLFFKRKLLFNKTGFKVILCTLIVSVSFPLALATTNYFYYDSFTYNEMNNYYFNSCLSKIKQIEAETDLERILLLDENSYLFNLSDNSKNNTLIGWGVNGNYDAGEYKWLIRELVFHSFNIDSSKEFNSYFKRLNAELDSLFDKGVLNKRNLVYKLPILNVSSQLIHTFYDVITYENIYSVSANQLLTNNKSIHSLYHYETYGDFYLRYFDARTTDLIFNIEYRGVSGFLNIIGDIYKFFMPLVFIISFLYFIFKGIVKRDKIFYFALLLFISYFIFNTSIAFNHVLAFRTIRSMYLGPAYAYNIIFILLIFISSINDFTKTT